GGAVPVVGDPPAQHQRADGEHDEEGTDHGRGPQDRLRVDRVHAPTVPCTSWPRLATPAVSLGSGMVMLTGPPTSVSSSRTCRSSRSVRLSDCRKRTTNRWSLPAPSSHASALKTRPPMALAL